MNILLGTTGSVAAILTPRLATALAADGHEVQIAATETSLYFWKPEDVVAKVWRDRDEWPASGYRLGDPITHIELRRWADIALIAPLSANTLAKLATAQADNLLTSVLRAWDPARPVIMAPAMNTFMWEHPATAAQLAQLREWYPRLHVVDPVAKMLACGDVGVGAMAAIPDLCAAVNAIADPSLR